MNKEKKITSHMKQKDSKSARKYISRYVNLESLPSTKGSGSKRGKIVKKMNEMKDFFAWIQLMKENYYDAKAVKEIIRKRWYENGKR